ncbi:SUKH-4 family immunity protein [Micromonospora rubida]|uniref:SUKH-4 family immunity protein n=1 Tax=Micromonospora rubida TaxID=2697657 RepID=A0ABW7STU4_9ACTN
MPGEVMHYSDREVALLKDEGGKSALVDQGLPREHLLFAAADHLTVHSIEGWGTMLRLGEVGDGDDLYVKADSGAVVTVSAADGAVWRVNRGIREFLESLAIFELNYPFYVLNADLSERETAVEMLRHALSHSDSTSLLEDPGFWNSVLFDVGVGDYAEE